MYNRFLIIKVILLLCSLMTISNASYIQYVKWYDATNGNRNSETNLPYKIGDKITFEMKVVESINDTASCLDGDAKVNIGIVAEDIYLYDTWLGDPKDGIYKYDHYITGDEKDGYEITSTIIKGFFIKNNKNATNSGAIKSENLISIDAKPPLILNPRSSINPFNPFLVDRTEISYQLQEKCESVNITIVGENFDFLKKLSIENASQGINFTTWDGRDDNGDFADTYPGLERITPDGSYIVQIKSFDFAGNPSKIATLKIKLTTVHLEIKNVNVMPTSLYKYGACTLEWDTVLFTEITGKNKLGETKIFGGEDDIYQLQILDFGIGRCYNVCAAADQEPWIVYSLSEFNSNGKEKIFATPANGELSSGVDTDYYYVNQYEQEFGELGSSKEDKGDGDDKNDMDNLKRMAILSELKKNKHEYTISCAFTRIDLGSSSGNYYYRIMATLSGRSFDFASKPEDKEEKWHMVPELQVGENISSLTTQVQFNIKEPPFEPGDTLPPYIIMYKPTGEVEPNTVGGPGDKGEVYAILDDDTKIDITKSKIEVLNPFGKRLEGKCTNDGNKKISYKLDAPIIDPGIYTLSFYIIDKFELVLKNGAFTKQFVVLDRMGPKFIKENPENDSLVREKINILKVAITDEKGIGLIKETLSKQGAEGHYKITLKNKDGKEIAKTGDGKTITEFITPADAQINIYGNYESGEVSFEFNSDLLKDIPDNNPDTYTWEVVVFDANNNGSNKTYTFKFSFSDIEIINKDDNKVYAYIPYTAKIKNNEILKINEIKVKNTSAKVPASPPYKFLKNIVEFTPNNIEFDQDITIIMHYTDELLNILLLKETDINVYMLDGKEWKIASYSFFKDEKENRISFKTNKILSQYAIMYSFNEGEKKETNCFNPKKNEHFNFYFNSIFPNKKITKAKVTIYNLAGEYICEINEKNGVMLSENLAAWDGKNEAKSIVNNGVYIAIIEAKDELNTTIYFKRLIAVVK
ncbi:MAG: hypothetical protein ABIB46_01555 [bacterium]